NKSNNSIPDNGRIENLEEGAKVDQLAALYSGGGTGLSPVHGFFSPVRANLSQSMESTGGGRTSTGQSNISSFLAKVLGSTENSLNRDASHHSPHKATEENSDRLQHFTPRIHGRSMEVRCTQAVTVARMFGTAKANIKIKRF
ncbi:hypothetical protein ElyMa_003482400, partial [Elysia marginata]